MGTGSIDFHAVNGVFDYLDIRKEDRLGLWMVISDIDAIYVTAIERDERAERNKAKKKK